MLEAYRRIAELERQLEVQGRNCKHYADRVIDLEREIAEKEAQGGVNKEHAIQPHPERVPVTGRIADHYR